MRSCWPPRSRGRGGLGPLQSNTMAIQFNGTSSSIQGASVPGASGNVDMAFCFWMKPDSVSSREFPFIMGNSNNNERLGVDAFSSSDALSLYDGAAAAGSTSLTPATWYHVLVNYSAFGPAILYLNGVSEATLAHTITLGNTIFSIGSFTNFLYFAGAIAEVAKYDALLSADDIKALSRGFAPIKVRPTALKFYAPLRAASWANDRFGFPLTKTDLTDAPHPRIFGG